MNSCAMPATARIRLGPLLLALLCLSGPALAQGGTIVINTSGWSYPAGTWDPATLTATLTQDLFGSLIVIQSDGITLDGGCHKIDSLGGSNSGYAAVKVLGRQNVTIRNLKVVDYYGGINIKLSNNCKVIGCTVSGPNANSSAIQLNGANNCSVEGNTIYDVQVGVKITGVGNHIQGNSITDAYASGIYVNSESNRIWENTVTTCGEGIWLTWKAKYNAIYNNNFINNVKSVGGSTTPFTSWINAGRPWGGNYWSDHTGSDADGDGFVDQPYDWFTGGAVRERDYLPWTVPDGWLALEPILPRLEGDAGPDQVVNEGDLVVLGGDGCLDPAALLWWTQVGGPEVTLDDPTITHPAFTAPSVPLEGATLTFQVTTTVGTQSVTDVAHVTVKNVNNAPFADAGEDQTVQEGTLITLDGHGSFDLDGEPITYAWTQTAGPAVVLSDATAMGPFFTAPLVGVAGATLSFDLVVSDGSDVSPADTVVVTVENVNQAPVAVLGADQTKDEGSVVRLDASGSSDPEGDPLTYEWTQVAGTSVVLDATDPVYPTFLAPLVGPGGEILVFELVVHDGLLASAADYVEVFVRNLNDPPSCTLATAGPDLWPPNHKMVPVHITGVVDPNSDDTITITVLSVTQDEPVNGLGDGDTSPDAAIVDGVLYLRAERSGTGDGRVYAITFLADDGNGGTCTGTVQVAVPHSRKKSTPAVDSGQLHDSFNQ